MLVRKHGLAGGAAMCISVKNWSTIDNDVELTIVPSSAAPVQSRAY